MAGLIQALINKSLITPGFNTVTQHAQNPVYGQVPVGTAGPTSNTVVKVKGGGASGNAVDLGPSVIGSPSTTPKTGTQGKQGPKGAYDILGAPGKNFVTFPPPKVKGGLTGPQTLTPAQALALAEQQGGSGQTPTQTQTPTTGPSQAYLAQLNQLLTAAGQIQAPQVNVPSVQAPQIPYLPTGGAGNSQFEQALLQSIAGQSGSNDLSNYLSEAQQLAGQAIQPSLQALYAQGQQGVNTINQFNQGAQQDLQGLQQQIGGYYNNAIGLQGKISNAIGSSLASQTPNAQDQADLRGIGAPQAQQQAVGATNQAGYGLGGAVLSGIGNLGASRLAAQKANNLSYAAQIPSLLSTQGQQGISSYETGIQTSLSNILSKNQSDAIKLAGTMQSNALRGQGNNISLYGKLTGNDARTATTNAGIAKTNATNTRETNQNNASNYLAAVRASTSAQNAEINRQKYIFSLVKAANPTATKATSSAAAKDAASFFQSASTGKLTSVTQPLVNPDGTARTNPSTGLPVTQTSTQRVGQENYDEAVQKYAVTHNVSPQIAQTYANAYYNFGQGDRPFTSDMQKALQKAGVPPTFYTDKTGQNAFITQAQAEALAKAGFSQFTSSLSLKNGVWVIPPLK